MSTTRQPDIQVIGGTEPTDELLQRLADWLLELTDEPSEQGEDQRRQQTERAKKAKKRLQEARA